MIKRLTKKTETDCQRQDTLISLLEKLSKLPLEDKLRLSESSNEVRSIARSHVLSTFRLVDPNRKAEALQFLYETRLIKMPPVINLIGTNLGNIRLKYAVLEGVEIRGSHFENSYLYQANFTNADFCGSNFTNADLRDTVLENTDLSFTYLIGANFKKCDLTKTNLEGAILSKANLSGAKILPEQLKLIASLEKTKFSGRK